MIGNFRKCILTAAALGMLVPAFTMEAQASRKHVREAIAAGVVGAAIGAALSHKHRHNNDVYYDGYVPPYQDNGYDDYWRKSFSPAPGVMCYNAERICYDANGTISHRNTFRIFGR